MCFADGRRNDRTSTIPIVFCLFGSIAGFPPSLGAIAIVRPETIVRWHRAGFRAYNETRTHLEASSAGKSG
jgi:hypothetical protein